MEFEQFIHARDYYYLAALLLGAGIGCILNRFRKKSTSRSRNWAITAGLCFFSGTVAALTMAIIYSKGLILLETSLYPYLGILTAVLILAFRFPRAAGFPIILITGVFIVWISYGYLRFPPIDDSGRLRVTKEGNGLIHIIPVLNSTEKALPVFSFKPERNDQIMEFRAFSFAFSKVLPLVGAVNRGDIAEIRCEEELLYKDPRFSNGLFPKLYPGSDNILANTRIFSSQEIPAKLELRKLKPGEGLTVFFDGTEISFR